VVIAWLPLIDNDKPTGLPRNDLEEFYLSAGVDTREAKTPITAVETLIAAAPSAAIGARSLLAAKANYD
jgi:hypothetical protein